MNTSQGREKDEHLLEMIGAIMATPRTCRNLRCLVFPAYFRGNEHCDNDKKWPHHLINEFRPSDARDLTKAAEKAMRGAVEAVRE